MVNNQAYLFIIFTIDGILIGFLFDFFRILRKSFKTKDFVTYIQDVLFWIITGILILYTMYKYCDGELRLFMIIGMIIGFLMYILTISRYIMRISVAVLDLFKKIFKFIFNILFYPFKIIYKLTKKYILRPVSKIFNRICNFICKYAKKIEKNRGIFVKKEKYNIV